MNTANILAVAAAIEQEAIKDLGFNMNFSILPIPPFYESSINTHSTHSCGTVACIAGWAAIMSKGDNAPIGGVIQTYRMAERFLGLHGDVAMQLFEPSTSSWGDIDRPQAVRTLRHLAATGNVDWTV